MRIASSFGSTIVRNIARSTVARAAALAIATAAATGAAPAMADEGPEIFTHNGSLMEVFIHADEVTISYARPKSSLRRLGVRPGTVLFQGGYTRNGIAGTAYVFRSGCQPAGYAVSGPDLRGQGIVLSGAAPVRPKGSCRVTGYTRNSGNARLEFWR